MATNDRGLGSDNMSDAKKRDIQSKAGQASHGTTGGSSSNSGGNATNKSGGDGLNKEDMRKGGQNTNRR